MPTDLPPLPMVGLTVRQPWANAIVHQGKHIENRSRRIPPKYLGAIVLIHAAKLAARGAVLPNGLELAAEPHNRGAVIGCATLAGCHREQDGCCAPWGERGTWHWQLDAVVPFPEPVPAMGFLGLWPPKDELVRAATAQIAAARRLVTATTEQTRAATALLEAETAALRAINDAREAGR